MSNKLDDPKKSWTGPEIREIVYKEFGIDLDRVSEEKEGKKTSMYSGQIMNGIRHVLDTHSRKKTDEYIMALPKVEAMDLYIEKFNSIRPSEVKEVVNQIFGIDLDGISNLSLFKISLFSKGQWISRQPEDLFIVSTGKGDVDVSISPTYYFYDKTDGKGMPGKLIDDLQLLGYTYDKETDRAYYYHETGETVPDSFKHRTISAIAQVVVSSSEHL